MIRLLSSLLDVILALIEEILKGSSDFIVTFVSQSRKKDYSADFIPVNKILNRNDTGFCLDGKYNLTIQDGFKNALVFGGSGSGKSSCVIVNSILTMRNANSSLIINDPSGELRAQTSGSLLQAGYRVKVLDFNGNNSEGYNPFEHCRTISDIKKLSACLIRNSLGESKDPFWNRSAENLISLFTRFLTFYAPKEYKNPHNLVYLVDVFASNPEMLDSLIVKTKDQKLIQEYKAIVATPSKTLGSVLATAQAGLSLFKDEKIAQITSYDSLDFNEFRNEKTSLFLNSNVADANYFAPLTALFFQQLLNMILRRIPLASEIPIFFLLDESATFNLPDLSLYVSNIRKYKCGIMLAFQDFHQIEHLYGVHEAKNILANCHAKIYLPGQNFESSSLLEASLGKFEYLDDKEIRRMRPLMTADEIRMTDRAIILLGNLPPIHAKLHPFYKNRKFLKLTKIPPYEPESTFPFETLPLISLDE